MVSHEGSSDGDAALVARIVAGDEAAFAAVYDRHVDVVFGSVVRFLRDRDAAEEIVQDAYLALWRNADRYLPSAGTLLGWLLRIARNKAIDRLRISARRPQLVDTSAGSDDGTDGLERALASGRLVGSGDAQAGPEQVVAREWARAVVRTALSAMTGPEREALELAYDEGLSQSEIAERLGWPLGTVKTRTRRGLATLRTALEGVPELVDEGAMTPVLRTSDADRRRSAGGGDGAR